MGGMMCRGFRGRSSAARGRVGGRRDCNTATEAKGGVIPTLLPPTVLPGRMRADKRAGRVARVVEARSVSSAARVWRRLGGRGGAALGKVIEVLMRVLDPASSTDAPPPPAVAASVEASP